MVELGYLLFGNPRGSFEVKRRGWFQDDFFLFFRRAGFTPRGFMANCPKGERLKTLLTECTNGYGLQNDTFMIRPYDWDPECSCGAEDHFTDWLSTQSGHKEDCYQTVMRARQKAVVETYGVAELHLIVPQARYSEAYSKYNKVMYELAAERGLPEEGCAVHCTCGFNDAQNKFASEHDHKDDCRYIQPNFRHKATGFELSWYKYPFRSSTTNVQIKRKKLKIILDDCLKSLGIDPNAEYEDDGEHLE